MSTKDEAKESLVRDLHRELFALNRSINSRGLEIARTANLQRLEKRKRQVITETINYLKTHETPQLTGENDVNNQRSTR